LQIADPRVSPDGKNVAFIEGLMSDEGSTGGEILVVPTTGGPARNLTPKIKSSPSAIAWTGSNEITFAENVDGNSGFGRVSVKDGARETLWTGGESAGPTGDLWAASGRSGTNSGGLITAIVRQSPTAPPEVWAGEMGKWKQLTSMNSDLKPAWGEMRNVHWMNGTTRVQGGYYFPKTWLLKKNTHSL
jgi:hypothetical protein